MIELLVWLWVIWCAVNVSLFVLGVLFARHDYPYFDGFKVHVPASWFVVLTPDEYDAIVMHENGHRRHLHVWKNLLRLLFCFPVTKAGRIAQELQADDSVSKPLALASALRKMSHNPFDRYRAYRLEAMRRVPCARDAR